jgi:sugar (pentulose or hexulose) kinase
MQTAPDKQEYLLSIDNGTQSVRAMIFDRDGHLVAKSKVEIEPYFSTEPGWAEQHAEYFWQALCQACHKLWEQLEIPRESIKAMSVTTQRATVVAMGADGQPLRAAISWLDQRQVDSKPELGAVESLLIRAVGAKVAVDTFHTQSEANWIAEHEPSLWQQVDKLLLLSGYHNYKLTGDYRDSVASQVGFIPFDFKQLQWAEAKDWKWRAIPSIKREMLPELVEAGGLLGHISSAAAAETGIPQGLPLIACGSDKACEVLGTGCLDSNTGSLSYGTTATFNITSDKYLEAIPFHPAYPGVIPGSFNVEMMVPRGYWMVSWFKQQFGLEEQSAAEQQGVTVESLFDNLLQQVPAGSDGLTLQPYWGAGADNEGPEAKGAIIGFGDVHTRAHLYRAIIEGLTYALRAGKERVEKRSGQPITRLLVSGGGSQSDQVMQITADIFGMPVQRPHTYETSALGAAMAAAVGSEIYPDFASAAAKMTHGGDRFEPIAANQKNYSQLYSQVYRKMYRGLKPSYEAIRKITGYPS